MLRVYHSGVVSAWRERDRAMRRLGVDVTHLSAARWNEGGSEVALSRGGDSFVRTARTLGRHPYRFVYDPVAVTQALRSGPYDIVDVHEEPASLAHAELRLLARLTGNGRAPMLFYGAQNISKRYPPPFRWFEQQAFRRSAGTYVCNEAAGEIFRTKGFTGVVRTIGLGVDVERFAPGAARPAGGPLRVGYVGRLEEHKGVHVLIEAIAGMGHHLDVYGDGPYRAELESIVARERAAVVFHGGAAHDALADIYRSFDVVAIPSQVRPNWIEQFGRVAVEAMASGVPVVAASTGSLPEVVADAGVLLAPTDVAVWRRALDELAADPQRRAALAAAGLERASKYSWDAIAGQHVALYREVLERAKR